MTSGQTSNVYETDKLLAEYLLFHYGSESENLFYDFGPKDGLKFPLGCAQLCLKHASRKGRALDIGCAVGRSSFELAKDVNEVVGMDYSQSFVNACNDLKVKGTLPYSMTREGLIRDDYEAKIDSAVDRTRCTFMQGDACDLPADLGQFDIVLAANLICRLVTPVTFLRDIGNYVTPGGILVVTSPYTFMEEYTPKENMIGGYQKADGTPVSGFHGLKDHLGGKFDLVDDLDLPFLIRETARKHQWTVAHATVWRRRSP